MPEIFMKRRRFLERTLLGAIGAAALPRLGLAAREEDDPRPAVVAPPVGTGPARLNVRHAPFGAKGDGRTNDTAALQQALDDCGAMGGGEVLVPAGRYRTGALQLRANTRVRLARGTVIVGSANVADYPVAKVRWEGSYIDGHVGLIYAANVKGVGISGPGKIVGDPALASRSSPDQPLRPPVLIEFMNCEAIHLQGFSASYAHMDAIHPTASKIILIEDLTIRSTGGNGDGIDIDSCRHVNIRHCDIATGDDCISLKSGSGREGYDLRQLTDNVTITDCTFAGLNSAALSIGSETSGGIRHVRIYDCKFAGAKTFAIDIRSRLGRGSFVSDILAQGIHISGTREGFLRFNLLNSGPPGEDPVPGLEGIPDPIDFLFIDVRVHDVPVLIDGLNVHREKPLKGLVLRNITGTCRKGITLANVKGAVMEKINVTGFSGPLLSVANVSGQGLDGAVTINGPMLL